MRANEDQPAQLREPRSATADLADIAARSAAQMGAENFPVALRVLPRRPRDLLARVYAFARFVDDVGDEFPGAPGERCAQLDVVDAEVRAVWAGRDADLVPVHALRPLATDGVPAAPFLDLIEANRVDQRVSRYRTFDDLVGYCRLSANPVGRIVLHVAGAATAANVADSDAVCTALQVYEHCQDVGEDARMGRVYLPAVDLASAGVADEALQATSTPDPLRRVIEQQVRRADDLLARGRPLVRRLSGWSRLAVAGYVAGGVATSAALRSADYDVLARAVRPAKARTATTVVRMMMRR